MREREISALGIVLTVTVILLMAIVWATSRIADQRSRTVETLEHKVVDWYIATGQVKIDRLAICSTSHLFSCCTPACMFRKLLSVGCAGIGRAKGRHPIRVAERTNPYRISPSSTSSVVCASCIQQRSRSKVPACRGGACPPHPSPPTIDMHSLRTSSFAQLLR